jgi:hypothetical protein
MQRKPNPPSETLDVETCRRILDVNLTGAVICAREDRKQWPSIYKCMN